MARRDERAYWKQSVIEEQQSQVDARPADEANAVLKQALKQALKRVESARHVLASQKGVRKGSTDSLVRFLGV
jgi:hypothetical protein